MSVRASSSSVGVRAWLASVSGAGAAVIETGEWASGSAKCMARCWDQCIGSDMGVHHQFRMQFGGQTNRQRGENRRISTMWIQSLKEWRGNCMRNWGGRVVLTEASGRHQSPLYYLAAIGADPHEGWLRSTVSGSRTLRGAGRRDRMITILIHIHVRST